MNWFAYFLIVWAVLSLGGLIYLLAIVIKTRATKLDSVPSRTKKLIGLVTYSLGPVGIVDILLQRLPFSLSPMLLAYIVMTCGLIAIFFIKPKTL